MSDDQAVINYSYPEGSLGSLSNPEAFYDQDYEHLKQIHLSRKRLYVDNTFPPDANSLGNMVLRNMTPQQVEWLRPADIMKRNNIDGQPSFLIDEASRFDFFQGAMGNSWFLAAVASLTMQKDLLVHVVPTDQTFSDYAGIFHFRFWRFGKWMDVVIDDFLPMFEKDTMFTCSKNGNVFWALLLEKAYAKVCGSYENMRSGNPAEAFKDFCGGVTMVYDLRGAKTTADDLDKMWGSLTNATKSKSIICCGTPINMLTMGTSVSHTGLVDGHAYAVTGVKEFDVKGSKVRLVRLMNPWGEIEWNGDWSDKSKKWDDVSSEDRESYVKREDGEFWMELEDFCQYFEFMAICCENPNFIDGDVTCQWKCMTFEDRWLAGRTTGGNIHEENFWKNPQFRFRVKEINEQEKEDKNIFLSLMQRPTQYNRRDMRFFHIGLTVFEVPSETPEGRFDSSFFEGKLPLKQRPYYKATREVMDVYSMQPGEYVIIPSTVYPNISRDFVLTVYSKTKVDMWAYSGHEYKITEIDPIDAPKATDGEDAAKDMFSRYADENGEMNDQRLQTFLNEYFAKGSNFELDVCRSMIAMLDTKQFGRMMLAEFSSFWNKFEDYKKNFYSADASQTGTLSFEELQKAMKDAGLDVDEATMHMLLIRFTGNDTVVSLENFLYLMLRVDNFSNMFKDKSKDEVMSMDWKEWTRFMYFF